jgi:uncharacterized membrane protein YfcA
MCVAFVTVSATFGDSPIRGLTSLFIGLSLGLVGGGGSILALPVLVYVAGLDVHKAIGVSLAVVGGTALVGGIGQWRHGRVSPRAAAVFGGAGMLAAPLGARATPLVPGRALLLLFAGLMLVVGALMLRGGPDEPRRHDAHWLALATVGGCVGLLTGFLGVGGGFLIVPGLTLLAGLPIERAIGTSLVVIAANSASGLASHLRRGGLPGAATAAFTLAAIAGALAGVRLARRLEARQLRRGFARLVILVGLALLARNCTA